MNRLQERAVKLFVRVVGSWIALALVATASAGTVAPAGAPKLEVFPPDVNLATARDRQSYVVLVTRPDGVTLDKTQEAKATLENPAVARLDKRGMVLPVADGSTQLRIEYEGQQLRVPVTVKDAKTERPVSFNLDVMPVFMRSGCNTGSCHGAARGKDGFMLSLFGYDPAGDHYRITHELGFRRINLALPEESLMLEKCDGSVPHTGGKRFAKDSEYYDSILRWLEAGVPNDSGAVPKVERVELYPRQIVLEGEGAKQQLVARAIYSDGTDRDVTNLAVFMSNNDNSALVSPDGLITAGARGEAFVMARFETHTVGMQVLTLPKDLKYSPPQSKPINYIDELVNTKLEKLRLLPSELAGDETFLRRVTVDITGLLPTEQEYTEFLADKAPNKRAKLIDRLLERKEFSEIWAMKWAELLLVKTKNGGQVSYKNVYLYATWLTAQISNDVPIDKMVQELLCSSGGTFKKPPTNYYQVETATLKVAENTAQTFMGIRTQCAQCHNHPFDRWTMNDYYSFAAFFAQVGRKQGEDYREQIIYNRGGGEVANPVTKKTMAPKFLGGDSPDTKGQDRREVLAKWLASPDNPYFATSIANRVWEHFFGIGIVQPVDDIRVSNPPSNPELFKALGDHFTQYHYNFKQLVRDICNSQTYQRATARNASNESDELNFAHARVRRIRAESLLDCISEVTETKDKFRGLPPGARAVQIADGATSSYFLDSFGRSPRDTVCACDAKTDPTLSQSLHLLNGDTTEGKIRAGGIIKRMLAEKKQPDEIIRTLYVRCLSRQPAPEELAKLHAAVAGEKDRQRALDDIFWAVLNSREFVFNH
jgi:hypothetical protein